MNIKSLSLWIGGILLGTVIIAGVWYAFFVPKSVPPTQQPVTTLPASGSITQVTPPASFATSSSGVVMMQLATQDGTTTTRDFIHDGVTIPDKTNTGGYLLAGNLGYCLSDPQRCQAAPATNFSVYYNSAGQSFIITLTEEPIGKSRLAAEQFMMTTLGLNQQQMCDLNYLVGVTSHVNDQYAGKNLGFSFCPSATKLPQ